MCLASRPRHHPEVDLEIPQDLNVVKRLDAHLKNEVVIAVFEFLGGDNCHNIFRWLLQRPFADMIQFT